MLPVPSKWLYSGTFFAGGILLAIRDPRLRSTMAWAPRLSMIAVCLTVATVTLGRWYLGRSHLGQADGDTDFANGVLAMMTTTSAWLITLSLIGLASKHVQSRNACDQLLSGRIVLDLLGPPSDFGTRPYRLEVADADGTGSSQDAHRVFSECDGLDVDLRALREKNQTWCLVRVQLGSSDQASRR